MVRFSFAGQELMALPQGALFWPLRHALIVADLHLEKASWFARLGQMLPPYDSIATLSDLTALVASTGACEVWCLGDSFHDRHGCDRLPQRARELLTALGLGHRLSHRPAKLSGGEQQRVAVARALANRPALVLADEPTGNLDEHTADRVLAEFLRLVRGEKSAALVATHNERLAAKMDRVVRLHDGMLA